MKKLIVLICGLLIFTSAYAQNKIVGIPMYSPEEDSTIFDGIEIIHLLESSYLVKAKIDSLEDGSVIKTVEIQCADTNFHFVGAYIESNSFFMKDIKLSMGNMKPINLVCSFALVDHGELYESYTLDQFGMVYFDMILNNTPFSYGDNCQ
jgi:hypothetical protein